MKGSSVVGIAAAAVLVLAAVQEAPAAGLRTDRLSPRQLKTWQAIEALVLATDLEGRPVYPTLHRLWRQAAESSHTIHIEMPRPKSVSPHTAGIFALEKPAPGGASQVGVIRLYLEAIDRAGTSDLSRRPNGLLPFEGLSEKRQRYAEVLGHELVHALLTLNNPDHARLSESLDRETQALAAYRQSRNGQALDDETCARLARIRVMSEEIERHPEAAEAEIWRELRTPSQQGTR
jgi:hypothetical protein